MVRSRIGAAVAAVALVGVSVFAGATVATAAPAPPVWSNPSPPPASPEFVSENSEFYVYGEALEGAAIEVSDTTTNTPQCSLTVTEGAWGCYVDLPVGAHVLRATAESDGVSEPSDVTVNIYSANSAVSIDPLGDTTDRRPQITGTGPAFGNVTVYDSGDNLLCDLTIPGTGTWACDPANEFPYGSTEVTAYGMTYDGAESEGSSYDTFLVTPPAPEVTYGDPGGGVTVNIPELADTTPFAEATLFGGETDSCTVADCTFALPVGVSRVDSYYQAAGETQSELTTAYFSRPADPTLDEPVLNPDGTMTFSGSGTQGDLIKVSAPGIVLCAATVPDGPWSCSTSAVGQFSASAQAMSQGNDFHTPDAVSTPDVPFTNIYSLPSTAVAAVIPASFDQSSYEVDRGTTLSLSGTRPVNVEDFRVTVQDDGEIVAECDSETLAATATQPTWSCGIASADLPSGNLTLVAGANGLDPATAATASLTVVDPIVETPPQTPRATPTPTPTPSPSVAPPKVPLTWVLTITGLNGPLKPGQKVTLSSTGLPAGSMVVAELHSTPVSLGSTTVRSDGKFSIVATIPKNVEPGDHHFVVTVTAPGDDPSTVENAVAIVPDDAEVLVAPDRVVADAPRLDDRQAEIAAANPRNEAGAPTALTGSVPTLLEILTSPATIGIAAGVALIIMLLIALPTEILNSTLSANTSRFGRTFGRIERATNAVTQWLTRVTRSPVIAAAALIVVAAIIFGFIDPGFGFDLASLRLVLSLGLALFVVTVGASSITGLIVGRAWSVQSSIVMQPVGLVFAIIGVVIARVLDFSPGFLIGLVIGLELSHLATVVQRTRATVVQFGVVVGLALLAWVGYSIAIGIQGDSPATFFSALVQDALAAVTAEGLTAITIALLPLGFLEGKEIFDRSKPLWVVMFLVVGTTFSLLVLPTAVQGQEVGNIAVWVIVLVVFAAITLGLWAWLRFTGPRAEAEEPELEKVDA